MLAGRLQILADGQEVDLRGAQIIHQLQHFVALLAQANHDPRLGKHVRIELLDPLQQPQGMEIAGSGPHRQVT